MRILHLSPRYLPAVGGAEIHLTTISEFLVHRGHEVTTATSDALDTDYFWRPASRRLSLARETVNGVRIRRFPVRHLPLLPWSYRGWRRGLWLLSRLRAPIPFLHRLARFTPAVPDLYRWLAGQAGRFDIVAGMNIAYEPFLEAGRRFARSAGLPFIVYPLTHLGAGLAPGADAVGSFYTMRHQVDTVRRSDLLIAQTATEKDFYHAAGLPADRAIIVGPGIWPARLDPADAGRARSAFNLNHPVILSLGSHSRDKGTGTLAAAFNRLPAGTPPADLVIAGRIGGELAAELLAYNHPRLHLLGPISEETKRDLLAAADILAMPSRVDSFGIVYLEAWHFGKPVVGAQAWGIADVIEDGVNGRLVAFGDVDALVTILKRLLTDPDERARLGAAGRKTAAAQAWPRLLDRIEAAYLACSRCRPGG